MVPVHWTFLKDEVAQVNRQRVIKMTLLAKIFGCGLENLFTWLLAEPEGPFFTWDQKVKKKKKDFLQSDSMMQHLRILCSLSPVY